MFYIERSKKDGDGWDIIMASPEPMSLSDIRGPEGEYPVNYNYPTFAGLPGMQARVRCDDYELERYVWDKVPENPNDPESFMRPGWKLVNKNAPAPGVEMSPSWLSVTGSGMAPTRFECGGSAPNGKPEPGQGFLFEPKPLPEQPSPPSSVYNQYGQVTVTYSLDYPTWR